MHFVPQILFAALIVLAVTNFNGRLAMYPSVFFRKCQQAGQIFLLQQVWITSPLFIIQVVLRHTGGLPGFPIILALCSPIIPGLEL